MSAQINDYRSGEMVAPAAVSCVGIVDTCCGCGPYRRSVGRNTGSPPAGNQARTEHEYLQSQNRATTAPLSPRCLDVFTRR